LNEEGRRKKKKDRGGRGLAEDRANGIKNRSTKRWREQSTETKKKKEKPEKKTKGEREDKKGRKL